MTGGGELGSLKRARHEPRNRLVAGGSLARWQAPVIALIAIAVYANALGNELVYDDRPQIVENVWLRDVRSLPDIFGSHAWGFQSNGSGTNYYRPLMYVAFLGIYQIFGLAPWAFHLLNLLLHAAVSLLVLVLARNLLARRPVEGSAVFDPAFVAAVLFAVHPIHTEAITWVSAFPEPAYTLLGLAAFLLHMRATRERLPSAHSPKPRLAAPFSGSEMRFRWLAAGALFLALLCKETAVSFLGIFLAFDYASRRATSSPVRLLRGHLPYALVCTAYIAIRFAALGGLAPVRRHVDLSAFELVINVFPLFSEYIGRLFFPFSLNAFHVFDPVRSALEPRALIGIAVTAAAGACLILAARRNRAVFLSLVLMLFPLLPVLYIAGLGRNTLAERYLYLPSVGQALLVSAVVEQLMERRRQPALALAAVAFVVSVVFAAATVQRNFVWRSDEILWSDTVGKSPRSSIAREALGYALLQQGRIDDAIVQLRAALAISPDLPEAHNNLGVALGQQGRLAEALEHLRRAIAADPRYAEAYNNLGNVYAAMGRTGEAAEQFAIATELEPDFSEAFRNLALARTAQGRRDEALAALEAAVTVNPADANARNDLGVLHAEAGNYQAAAAQFSEAAQLQPDDTEIRANLDRVQRLLRQR